MPDLTKSLFFNIYFILEVIIIGAFTIYIIIIILFNANTYDKVIYLEKCYRLAEESIVMSDKNIYYLSYNDCEKSPRRIKINNVLFIEQ